MRCEECHREYQGEGTCPHCAAEIAYPYESEVNPAAGGDPLAIVGNLLIFVGLLPMMLFAWSWWRFSAGLAGLGVLCHAANLARRAARPGSPRS